jgi:hypothetical protein
MTSPFYYAVVWRGKQDKILGTMLTIQEYQSDLKYGAKLWSFTGRKATVCVVTFDNIITRETALDFAIMFMKGKYVTIAVDLKTLTSTATAGSEPPCY